MSKITWQDEQECSWGMATDIDDYSVALPNHSKYWIAVKWLDSERYVHIGEAHPTREEAKAACERHANTHAAAPTRHATPSARPERGLGTR